MSKESHQNTEMKIPSSPSPSLPVDLDEKKPLGDLGTNRLSSATATEQRSPPPAYQPIFNYHHSLSSRSKQYVHRTSSVYFYQPTPSPQTVIVHDTPTRSKDACCWGCVAGLILCLGAKECLCF